jgi:hypothetical protein
LAKLGKCKRKSVYNFFNAGMEKRIKMSWGFLQFYYFNMAMQTQNNDNAVIGKVFGIGQTSVF